MNDTHPNETGKEEFDQNPPDGCDVLEIPDEQYLLPDPEYIVPKAVEPVASMEGAIPGTSSTLPIVHLAFPLCSAVLVGLVCLAAFLAAPARFRLDPSPGVVQMSVEDDDRNIRSVPQDATGAFRLRPGKHRLTVTSGGLPVFNKELTLNSKGEFFDGKTFFDFDRFAARLTIDSGATQAVPFINGRRADLGARTVRLPNGAYDVILLAGDRLSETFSLEQLEGQKTLQVEDFPKKFRDGTEAQHENALVGFFGTLYALDPHTWDLCAPGVKAELIDFFYQAFCVPTTFQDGFEEIGGNANRHEDDTFERRLSLLRDRIRTKIQGIILELDAAGQWDTEIWWKLLRATTPWEQEAVGDWQYYHARSLVFSHLGQWNQAGNELERGFERAPGKPNLHLTYARVLAAQGRFEEARSEVAKAVKLDPAGGRKARMLLAEIDVRDVAALPPETDRKVINEKLLGALTLLDEALQSEAKESTPDAEPRDAEATDVGLLFLRHLVYIGLGRDAEADRDWREYEKRMKPEKRTRLFEMEMERERWKERFRER